MRIVVHCPNLVGDTVMATPTIRALRQRYPDAFFSGLIKRSIAETLGGAPWFDELICFDKKGLAGSSTMFGTIRTLQARRFDLAVLLPNSFRSALLPFLARVPDRVGYARGGRGFLLTHRLQPKRDQLRNFVPTPIIEYYLDIARSLDCPIRSNRCELFTTEFDEDHADTVWTRLGLPENQPVVALNTGGAFGPAKNWPIRHFVSLAQRLVRESHLHVLVICGPAERESAKKICVGANHPRVVSLAEEDLGIGLSKACIKRSALLVTTDSGPRHFAEGFGVPVISLFGPTHIAWTKTYHPLAEHLSHPVDCGPCQRPTCFEHHHKCMEDLSPDLVFKTAQQMLVQTIDKVA